MRQNMPVTDREETFGSDERLISTTNLRGVIEDANDTFVRVSGFSRDELEGQPHNIVRHPDMPEAVYANFWETLKSGNPWMGLVKNRCKNGDHYWVSAYVSPIYKDGEHIGFQSVRTQPSERLKQNALTAYRRMKRGARSMPLSRCFGMGWQMLGAGVGAVIAALAAGYGFGGSHTAVSAAIVLLGALAAGALCLRVAGQIRTFKNECKAVFDNDLGAQVYGNGNDLMAQARVALAMRQSQLEALRGRVEDLTDELTQSARDAREAAESGQTAAGQQENEIQQVATAMEEMSSTVEEVSANTSEASDRASQASEQAKAGSQTILETSQAMESLAEEIKNANKSVQRLREQALSITSVVDVITGIADQTNLLALNAAIEAARAGENGRGFAVVADEVRQLAHRVSESTKEIRSTIDSLSSGTESTVQAMDQSCQFAEKVQLQAQDSSERIQSIEANVEQIRDMANQIATAAEEQSSTAADMTHRVNQIHENSQTSAAISESTRNNSDTLEEMVHRLEGVVRQFRLQR
ncbi:PAS domain-containing methyl-accepting chemotaxis protein [uncultured Halovibrio sp.]|uniref:methyl-accepting chemotaxis protein n=1 Tax=uncultured Halovibrio sp. TaxID=985049 RepID=UPI0025CC11DD|nr:PAS domain-containing methyl-accepting chemotaxis protein [uncultured Halovibrio sp.]